MDRTEMIKRVESGEDPIDISIKKYNDLKEMIRNGKRITHKYIRDVTCALCYTQPNHRNEKCSNCPLHKINQVCSNKESAWYKLHSLLKNENSSNESIINAIDDFINVLKKCK